MYSLVAGSSPLPVRTLADDRDAVQRMAIREASLVDRKPLSAVSSRPGVAGRIRRAIGLAPAGADGVVADCTACAA